MQAAATKPTHMQKLAIALKASRSLRTVDRVYEGSGAETSHVSVRAAARELGYPEPEPRAFTSRAVMR